jgi:hypothetical protein
MTEFREAVFEYSEDGPGLYKVMVVEVVETNEIMRSNGWSDGMYLYILLNGQVEYADYDARRFTREFTKHDDDMLLELLLLLKDEGWPEMEWIDGKRLDYNGDVV